MNPYAAVIEFTLAAVLFGAAGVTIVGIIYLVYGLLYGIGGDDHDDIV